MALDLYSGFTPRLKLVDEGNLSGDPLSKCARESLKEKGQITDYPPEKNPMVNEKD
jgi:hypothetical protein